jgi:hypothetical protein
MQMSTPAPLDPLRKVDEVKEHRDAASADTMLGELGSDEQPQRVNPLEHHFPEEGSFETFVHGAGI